MTQEEVDYQEFEQFVAKIVYITKMDEKSIMRRVGRNPGYISQLRSRYKHNKSPIPEGFLDLLKLHFPETALPEGGKLTFEKVAQIVDDTGLTKDQVLLNLTTTNKTLADSNYILVENNRDLIQLHNLSLRAHLESQSKGQHLSQSLYPYLDKIAQALVGKYWATKDEGLAVLGKILVESVLEKQG